MAGMDKVHQPTGKRERINPTGAEGGSRYLRRDTHGRPISDSGPPAPCQVHRAKV